MRVGRPVGGAFHRGRASAASLLLGVTVGLAEPDHFRLEPDEKPDRKDANHLTTNSGAWKSHGNENFKKGPRSCRKADCTTTPSLIHLG